MAAQLTLGFNWPRGSDRVVRIEHMLAWGLQPNYFQEVDIKRKEEKVK